MIQIQQFQFICSLSNIFVFVVVLQYISNTVNIRDAYKVIQYTFNYFSERNIELIHSIGRRPLWHLGRKLVIEKERP